MTRQPPTLPDLRSLLGQQVRHRGTRCTVVEILDAPLALVLQPHTQAILMADQHGRPAEYGAPVWTLPVLSEDDDHINNTLVDLEILD